MKIQQIYLDQSFAQVYSGKNGGGSSECAICKKNTLSFRKITSMQTRRRRRGKFTRGQYVGSDLFKLVRSVGTRWVCPLLGVLDGSFLELVGGIVSTILLLLGFCLGGNVTVDTGVGLGNLLSVVGSTLRFFLETRNFFLGLLDVLLDVSGCSKILCNT
jgi:hypothetical protein